METRFHPQGINVAEGLAAQHEAYRQINDHLSRAAEVALASGGKSLMVQSSMVGLVPLR